MWKVFFKQKNRPWEFDGFRRIKNRQPGRISIIHFSRSTRLVHSPLVGRAKANPLLAALTSVSVAHVTHPFSVSFQRMTFPSRPVTFLNEIRHQTKIYGHHTHQIRKWITNSRFSSRPFSFHGWFHWPASQSQSCSLGCSEGLSFDCMIKKYTYFRFSGFEWQYASVTRIFRSVFFFRKGLLNNKLTATRSQNELVLKHFFMVHRPELIAKRDKGKC